jgi:hypothetical protein
MAKLALLKKIGSFSENIKEAQKHNRFTLSGFATVGYFLCSHSAGKYLFGCYECWLSSAKLQRQRHKLSLVQNSFTIVLYCMDLVFRYIMTEWQSYINQPSLAIEKNQCSFSYCP